MISISRRTCLALLLSLGLSTYNNNNKKGSLFVSSQNIEDISNINSGWGALKHSNGDKVAIGRFNTLHTVWQDGALIKYSSSSDGIGWTVTEIVAPGIPGALPAIASDSDGTLTVVFVKNPDANDMGDIYYVRKPWGGSWSTPHHLINAPATHPDIAARGGTVHVAWSTVLRVQYKQFPTDTPPAAFNFGEEIEVTGCAGTGFLFPSVALVQESCETIAKVAYVRYSDETTNPDTACTSLVTEVGPRVCKREANAPTWSLDYTDLITTTNPASSVEAISLSMNAEYKSGNAYVAWSDTSNGISRTSLAHGKGANWNKIDLNTAEHHIHVAAKRSSYAGDFRYAMVKKYGSWTDFTDQDAIFRTGKWSGISATPTWSHPDQYVHTGEDLTVGRPQATFWAKCSSGQYDTVEVITEYEGACASTRIVSHVSQSACPGPSPYPIDPCNKLEYAVAYYYRSRGAIVIDASEIGNVGKVGERYAEIKPYGRDSKGYLIMWDKGNVIQASEGLLSIDFPDANIKIDTGDKLEVELIEMNESRAEVCTEETCPCKIKDTIRAGKGN